MQGTELPCDTEVFGPTQTKPAFLSGLAEQPALTPILAALAVAAPLLLNATVSHCSETQLAFLPNSEKDQQTAIEVPTLPPPLEANPFDGRWVFTGGGCRGAGTVSAVIKGGKVIVRGAEM